MSLLFLPVVAFGATLRRVPLDEARAVVIALGTGAPTTVRFPGAIAGLEVADISAKAEDRPAVLLSHQPGSALFSVRALKPDARAAANVIYGGKVYVIDFAVGPEPDRSVEFVEAAGARRIEPTLVSRARPESLVARAKVWALLQAQEPELARTVGHSAPGVATEYRGYRATVAEVWRFGREDALVFRLRVENRGSEALRIEGSAVAVRVGPLCLPVEVAEGPEGIAGRQAADLWAVAWGEGESKGISVENEFRAVVPRAA